MGTRDLQYTQSIYQGAAEINGGRLFKILGGTGDLSDVESFVDDLGEHLVVEYKVV